MQDDVIELASYLSAPLAQVQLGLLQEADVAAFLTGELTGDQIVGARVSLFVARADLKRARDVLADSENRGDWLDDDPFQAEEGYWPCPHCGDAVPESDAACPSCGTPLDDRPG
jgi:hypothetical protein